MRTRSLGPDGPQVSAIGFGCMYLSIGDRPKEEDAEKTLLAAIDAGVTLLDTADVYCRDDGDIGHNERLIARAVGQRKQRVWVATKGGLKRPRGAWTRDARPGALRQACERSLAALGVDTIDVYQLHAPDPEVPLAESVGALARLREQGKIRYVGLSNVTVSDIETARAIVPIASVQNRWSPLHRVPETDGVLSYCEKYSIAFLPYSPFGGSTGARNLDRIGTLGDQARKRDMSPHRLVLAWMLTMSPIVIPIPGATRITTLLDSLAADTVHLTDVDVREIEASFT
jgi:aryl-alcohol dehydrogenase-like predicted oxidoreductase